jgi:hypothetical protein
VQRLHLIKLQSAYNNINQKMMKNRFNILPAIITIVVTVLPFFAMAQDPTGSPDAPIDGGLSVLIAAGAAYGVKKYRDHKKKNNEDAGQDLK